MRWLEDFLIDLDQRWGNFTSGRLTLPIFGSTALMLQTSYERGTKDGDVLETTQLQGPIAARLRTLAGPRSVLYERHRLYIDLVHPRILFLPEEPAWADDHVLTQQLDHFNIKVLDVVDVIVTKLWRFSPSDRADIQAMAQRGLVESDTLAERFQSAVYRLGDDARAEDLPRIRARLHQVQREHLDAAESDIELPSWVE